MDALTFRTPKLLRKMGQASSDKKQPIIEIDFAAALSGLNLSYESFIDLCIMMGCDYCGTIKGVGPKTALQLIRQHGCLENIIKALLKNPKTRANVPPDFTTRRVKKEDPSAAAVSGESAAEEVRAQSMDTAEPNFMETDTLLNGSKVENHENVDDSNDVLEIDLSEMPVGTDDSAVDIIEDVAVDEEGCEYETILPVYVEARKLFYTPEVHVAADVDLRWVEPDEANLREFLVEKMGFNLERVNNGIKKLQEAQKKKSQGRMDSFFAVAGVVTSTTGQKRKAEEQTHGKTKFSGKTAGKAGSFAKKR